MWFLRRNKRIQESKACSLPCPSCGSTHTKLNVYHGTDQPNFVRVWKGQRVLTYRCIDCGQDFYGDEPPEGISDELMGEDRLIDDEEALRAAEEEIKRQVEEDDDRRCR